MLVLDLVEFKNAREIIIINCDIQQLDGEAALLEKVQICNTKINSILAIKNSPLIKSLIITNCSAI